SRRSLQGGTSTSVILPGRAYLANRPQEELVSNPDCGECSHAQRRNSALATRRERADLLLAAARRASPARLLAPSSGGANGPRWPGRQFIKRGNVGLPRRPCSERCAAHPVDRLDTGEKDRSPRSAGG